MHPHVAYGFPVLRESIAYFIEVGNFMGSPDPLLSLELEVLARAHNGMRVIATLGPIRNIGKPDITYEHDS